MVFPCVFLSSRARSETGVIREDLDWDLSCSLTVLQMEPAAGMEPSVTRVDVDSPRDGTSVLSAF